MPMIDKKAYANACGCGAAPGVECPHTPIRCPHEFRYEHPEIAEGAVRTCGLCGFQERAEMTWRVVRSAYGSPSRATEGS